MKKEGVQKGACDYILLVSRKGFHGLALELKVEKTGKVSPEQKTMIQLLSDQGYFVCVAYGWDQAQIDGLEGRLADFNRDGTGEAFTAVVGPSSGGAQVTATLSFARGSGTTPVTLTFEPAQ